MFAISTVSCSYAFGLALGCKSAKGGLSQVVVQTGESGGYARLQKLVVRHLEQKTREKHLFSSEEHLERTESSVASADLTLETDGKNNIQHFLVGVLLHRNDGFNPIAY